MNRRLVFRSVAAREFEAAVLWYDQKAGLGARFVEEVDRKLAEVLRHPEAFRAVRGEVRRALVRGFPYSLHFRIEPQQIIVLAVFHSSQDPRQLSERH
jgi:plasmid stabilization system protein ParE